jgi:hypothetical protein
MVFCFDGVECKNLFDGSLDRGAHTIQVQIIFVVSERFLDVFRDDLNANHEVSDKNGDRD